jgi:hypothetical protein
LFLVRLLAHLGDLQLELLLDSTETLLAEAYPWSHASLKLHELVLYVVALLVDGLVVEDFAGGHHRHY